MTLVSWESFPAYTVALLFCKSEKKYAVREEAGGCSDAIFHDSDGLARSDAGT
jgi:hypothetical protein